MKKRNLNQILEVLVDIKAGIRSPMLGICINLFIKLHNTNALEEFIGEVFNHKYGDPDIMYPIEGDQHSHQDNKDKWNPETTYGKLRLELLDDMIEYCQEWIKRV